MKLSIYGLHGQCEGFPLFAGESRLDQDGRPYIFKLDGFPHPAQLYYLAEVMASNIFSLAQYQLAIEASDGEEQVAKIELAIRDLRNALKAHKLREQAKGNASFQKIPRHFAFSANKKRRKSK